MRTAYTVLIVLLALLLGTACGNNETSLASSSPGHERGAPMADPDLPPGLQLLLSDGEAPEEEVQHRMEAQHQAMIRDIFNGKYDKEAPKPFGHAIITDRSLDEVVLDYLHQDLRPDPIRLELIDEQTVLEGTRPTMRMKVLEEGSDDPVPGAAVVVRLISTSGDPCDLFSASTDNEGFIEAAFEIPSLPGEDSALILSAEAGGQNAELRQFVVKVKP